LLVLRQSWYPIEPVPDDRVQLRIESQQAPVADEVSAIIAIVRPILEGVLYAIKGEILALVGGPNQVPLKFRPPDIAGGVC
jgi:hypothetical protein